MPNPSLTVTLPEGRSYPLCMAALTDVPRIMAERDLQASRCIVVTDRNVANHYLYRLLSALQAEGWSPKEIILPPGEKAKGPDCLQTIYDTTLSWGIDRDTPVLALGGGVIGDLTGFAAATMLRGLPFIQLPTTLIAQVDSSLGGKTGINHPTGKNLVGAFHQPRAVIADLSTLRTLPELEWTSGLAEVVKHALIADRVLLALLEEKWASILTREPVVIQDVIFRAAQIKAHIVSEDEQEQGRRAILNFGHTFGHAIERVAGYGRYTHGEAVALGMRAALHVSRKLHPKLSYARANQLVQKIPVRHPLTGLPIEDLMAAMRTDKKVRAGQQRLVVLRHLGEAYVTSQVATADIAAAWAAL